MSQVGCTASLPASLSLNSRSIRDSRSIHTICSCNTNPSLFLLDDQVDWPDWWTGFETSRSVRDLRIIVQLLATLLLLRYISKYRCLWIPQIPERPGLGGKQNPEIQCCPSFWRRRQTTPTKLPSLTPRTPCRPKRGPLKIHFLQLSKT